MNFISFPKIELHLHLDCSLSFEAARRLNPHVTPEKYRREFLLPPKCKNLADFLTRVPNILTLLQTEEGLRVAVGDLFQQLAEDSVIYAEIRFAPLLHTEKGLKPEEVIEIVEEAVSESSSATGIEARIILCTLRHFNQEQSLQTARLVEQFRGTRVTALDLAADEAGYPLEAHVPAFQYAIERNIPRIAHAGEARGPESVWETLEQLRPSRIGHGVRSIEDSELMNYLVQQNIHLEVCPTCNVQIDIYDTYADHPINRLYEAGISLGINTDGRTLPHVTLSEEYERLRQVFGWNKEHFLTCNLNALQAAFLPGETKAQLERRLRGGYE